MIAIARMIPPTVLRRITDRATFLTEVARYDALSDDELLRTTEVCLRNLERIDDRTIVGPDADLQLVLVPELWERLRPGTRDRLRRLSSTIAEYRPDPTHVFAKLLSPESRERLCSDAEDLRQRVEHAARLDACFLVEQTRFAIAGSSASRRWLPEDFVYEPGFVYRLVPAIAARVLSRHGRSASP